SLEPVIQTKLHHPRTHAVVGVVLRCDLAEARRVHILIVQKEARVIEDVEEIRVQFHTVTLRNLHVLHHREIVVPVARSVETAPLQTTQRPRLGIEEYLSRERSRTIRRNASRIRSNRTRIEPVRSV